MYNSRILKSRNISVVDPVYIEVAVAAEEVIINEDESYSKEEVEEYTDPEKTAEDIIAKAKEEAVSILEQYQLQMEEMKRKQEEEINEYREKVFQDAYDEGYNKGYEEGKGAFDKALKEVQSKSDEFQANYKELLGSTEPQIIKLVLSIAKKVINEDVKINQDNMLSLVKQAIEICYKEQSAVIKLSVKDYDYIKSTAPEMITAINDNDKISLKEDMLLKEGDCVVETSFGTVDLGIDKRFEKINEEFSDIINL